MSTLRAKLRALDAHSAERLAVNDRVTTEELEILATDRRVFVRKKVASNTSTPAATLIRLAGDKHAGVRSRAAQNQSTPQDVHDALARDEDAGVRWRLAYNRNLAPSAARILVADREGMTRRNLADSSATLPADVVADLMEDANPHIHADAANHLADYCVERLGIAADNTRAQEVLRGKRWWTMTEDSVEVRAAKRLHRD